MVLEPQNCRPPVRETEYQPSEYQLSGIRTQRNPNSAEYEHSGIPTQRKCELSENANSVKMRTQRKCELSENANSAKMRTQRPFFSRLGGRIFHAWGGDTENRLLLQEESVHGLLRHHRQQHVYQHPSVKKEAISKINL